MGNTLDTSNGKYTRQIIMENTLEKLIMGNTLDKS